MSLPIPFSCLNSPIIISEKYLFISECNIRYMMKGNFSLLFIILSLVPIDTGVWFSSVQFGSVQSLGHVRLFETPWTTARQASLSITNSRSPHKPMSIESVMPSNHLILCHPLPLLPSIFPSIRVFSNESVLRIRWPKYWSFSFNINPANEHPGLISPRMLKLLHSCTHLTL